jgi:predicted RNase H-like nuclease (RuvC/YqgF family)
MSWCAQVAEKERDVYKSEVDKKDILIEESLQLSSKQEKELKRLDNLIFTLDSNMSSQKKEYDQVVSQRDILGTQLIRRNDELALLYEKLRVQQSALSSGEAQYRMRIDDIRVLKSKIRELSRDETLNLTSKPQVDELHKEMAKLQQTLYNERLKVTALSEEMENPLNVHRWRKLEGSDPAGYELIQKVQTLQRRLISKTEEVVEKSLVIKEKDKLYAELKITLERQPGPEVAEQLSVYQQNMKQKTRQMKALASELNMYQAQVHEYRYEIERLTRDLQEMKKKYYQLKKKDELRLDMDLQELQASLVSRTMPAMLLENQQDAARKARLKFAGGGYVIK